MEKDNNGLWRYIFIAGLFLAVLVTYIVLLINLQVSGQDYYTMSSPIYTSTRTVGIQAMRGEIFDRNGKKLVSSEYHYNIELDYSAMPYYSSEKNDAVIGMIALLRQSGEADSICDFRYRPFIIETDSAGTLRFSYNSEFFALTRKTRFFSLIKDLSLDEDCDAQTAGETLLKHYNITDKDGNYTYSPDTAAMLLQYRLDFDISDFAPASPYLIAEDVSGETLAIMSEGNIPGTSIVCETERIYNYPGYASHILGLTGKIPAADVEYYTELGYPLDATVGVSGVESAFEKYLHGIDGEMTITEDRYGNILKTEVTKEPVAGMDVYLTIDIDLQMTAEKALVYNIEFVHEEAKKKEGEYTGEDSKAGAVTAVIPDSGDVIVMASYPTYDLSTFDKDYKYLNEDENTPMVNRVLNGIYQPGSTFKPGVAVAALDSNIITPYTTINDLGQYTYYETYQPRCWIYLMFGQTHGYVNVTEAIQESCNYFFYDVGRQLTIENINKYMEHFGLGQPTGIELPESTGVLDGPDYRNDNGLESWNPGDTLQAAIGQTDLFTPLQVSMYITTLINHGTRYSAHILYKVCEYGTDEVVYSYEPTVLDSIDLDDESCDVVLQAMKDVIDEGSAAEVFEGYEITVGGKTGTAQVSEKKSDNAIFTAFAPFDDPQLVSTCVIEQGNTGSNAGVSVKLLFDKYFGLDEKRAEKDDDETGSTGDGGE